MSSNLAELDWYSCPNPDPLLQRVWPRPGEPKPDTQSVNRRLRLFGTACARMVWHLLPTGARNAVQLSERFAEVQSSVHTLRAAAIRLTHGPSTTVQQALNAAGWASIGYFGPHPRISFLAQHHAQWNPAEAARNAAKALANHRVGPPPPGHPTTSEWHAAWTQDFNVTRSTQADILRDIFPPPGLTITLAPQWHTSSVLELANIMATSGDYSAVPILADALEDAGCTLAVALAQCRHPGPHVRGNWVVDKILGRQ